MITIQCIGTKDKTDFILYLAHTIASQGKKVLVADSSKDFRMMNGVATLAPGEYIHEVQGVEIVCGVHSLHDIEQKLKANMESLSNYECLILDIDSVVTLTADWGAISHTMYISDNDRFNINRDITLLNRYLDENDKVDSLRRVHFESSYRVPSGYIEMKMNYRITFTENSFELDYDEKLEDLRIMLQHNQIIPYGQLTRNYKNVLKELVVEWFEVLPKDVDKAAKPNIFGKYKKQPQVS